jgi:maltokinase
MPSPAVDGARVETWLRAASVHELLPERRRDVTEPSASVQPLDVMPLGVGSALAVARAGDGMVIVVPIAVDGKAAPRRAAAGDGAFASILHAMRSGTTWGRFRAEAFGRVPSASDDESAIDVDQSNDSVVVGGAAVVKLFPLTSPGPQPGLDLPVHLASVGFTSLPTPLGALRWTSAEGDDVVLATAATFLPGARDGWAWYLERLVAWLDADVDDAVAFGPAPVLGDIAARMHAALATPSAVLPRPTAVADAATAEGWRRSAIAVAEEAAAVTDGDEGSRLAARIDAIRRELDRLSEAAGAVTTRVHGDFHVGQILEWNGGYAVTDLDGNPVAPPAERGALDTPVRDVAAFVRSIDHVGRIASRRRPGREDAVGSWIARSRDEFLGAYRLGLEAAGAERVFDPKLLRPLEVAQECHEYVYAARFLPRWRYVPDLAIEELFPMEHR